MLDEVYDSLINEVSLEISMASRGESKQAVLNPLGMIMYNNGLYLVAHYEGQKSEEEPYKFKLESFISARCLKDKTFKYPQHFVLRDYVSDGFGIYRDRKATPVEVELEFVADEGIKQAVRERVYTRDESYEELPVGRMVLRFAARGLTEVTSWVLSWGANVRVVGPEELRRGVAEAARRMVEINGVA